MIDPPRAVATDAELNADIHAYEDRYGLLTEDERQRIRKARRQELTEERPRPTHPYGGHMRQGDDPHSPGNRAQIKLGLYLYFDDGRPLTGPYRGTPLLLQEDDIGGALADQLNQRRDAATGLELNDRVVSRFELGAALQMQWRTAGDEAKLLERRYCKLESIEQICAALHIHERQYYNRLTEAIDTLISMIYISDFTEAKSRDMAEESSET